MKKKVSKYLVAAVVVCAPLMGLNEAKAYESITAQEAYHMVASGRAEMLDVRSLEELYWVGSPALIPGGLPISYVIPWKFYTINSDGTTSSEENADFDELVLATFQDADLPIITICRSGGRSSAAADRLESLGYTNVYEVDNAVKGGRGGFQGSSYSNVYEGYRGYPERLPHSMNPHRINVKTDSDRITNDDDSVSWVDTGLPITQKLDTTKIPSLN